MKVSQKVADMELASERASKYAPLPKISSMEWGLGGAFITGNVAALYGALAGASLQDHPTAFTWTVLAGFFAPFFYFKREEKKHYKAIDAEYRSIVESRNGDDAQVNAPPTQSQTPSANDLAPQ